MKANPISPTIPLDQDGVHHGFLKLPYSRDDSAWGSVMIPLTVIKHGEGPTALLTGANHGDEYEGPIALQELAATTKAEDVTGRLIIVPAFNYPAYRAGTRTSPIDKGNMNRSFPGRPDGTVTEKIADYFQRTLLPMADLAVDFHSGGKTLDFVPFAAAHILDDKATQEACFAAMRAFNAPYSVELLEIDSAGMYDTAVEEMGKVLGLLKSINEFFLIAISIPVLLDFCLSHLQKMIQAGFEELVVIQEFEALLTSPKSLLYYTWLLSLFLGKRLIAYFLRKRLGL